LKEEYEQKLKSLDEKLVSEKEAELKKAEVQKEKEIEALK